MNLTPALKIEIQKWGANSIVLNVDDGVYICTCNVKNVERRYKTSHAFAYDSNLKPSGQKQSCGELINNRKNSPLCVLN